MSLFMLSKVGMICAALQQMIAAVLHFHPAMPDEPLIFVEVALTRGTPNSIQTILSETHRSLAAAVQIPQHSIQFQIVRPIGRHFLWQFPDQNGCPELLRDTANQNICNAVADPWLY